MIWPKLETVWKYHLEPHPQRRRTADGRNLGPHLDPRERVRVGSASPTGRGWVPGQVEAEKSLAPAGKHSPVRLRRESSAGLVWHCVVPIFGTRLRHLGIWTIHPIPLMWIWSLITAVSGRLAKALGGTTTCPRHVGRRSIRSRMGSITLLYLYNHVSQSRPYFCWHSLSHSTRTPADH